MTASDLGAQDGTGGSNPGGGAVLREVRPNTAAAAAGLQPGDVVVKFGDRPITSADELVAACRASQPGARVEIKYIRNGQERTATATLGSEPGGG